MTLTLNLSEEQVTALQAKAAAKGLSLEGWLQQLAEPSEPLASQRPEGRKSLAQLFADSPFRGLDVDFERDSDYGRDVSL